MFAVWHAIGQESGLSVLASAFILVSVLIVVILFEYLHWSYVVVVVVVIAFVGAISIIVAALVLDRLTHKKRALS